MCFSSPSTPAAPDPAATIAAQNKASVEQATVNKQVQAQKKGVRSTLNSGNLFAGASDTLLGPSTNKL